MYEVGVCKVEMTSFLARFLNVGLSMFNFSLNFVTSPTILITFNRTVAVSLCALTH